MEEELKALEKRKRKAEDDRALDAANDPFGAELIDPSVIALAKRAKQLDEDDY